MLSQQLILKGLAAATAVLWCAASAAAATHTVGPPSAGACGGSGCDFNALQSAIDAAAPGDLLTVYRRTDDAANNQCYNEHLVIDKPLTLDGASTTPASAACIGPSTGGDVVLVLSSDVTLRDLEISGRANNGAGGQNGLGAGGRSSGHGIHVYGDDIDNVQVINCTVDYTFGDNIRYYGDRDLDGDGFMVIKQSYLHHSDTRRNLRILEGGGTAADEHVIRNNLIHTGHGVLVSGECNYITIEKNVVKGWPFWGHLGGSFPQTRDASHGGGWRYYSNCPAGIWATDPDPTNLVIQNNLVISCRTGIRVNTTGTIRNNTVVNPFNASQYDYNVTADPSTVRDHTYGIMIASGFGGTIQNNIVVVTADNRANGDPGQTSGTYYTPGLTGYGIAFEGNFGALSGATLSNNNVWGFVDTDGATSLNYGSGITQSNTNLSLDPQFANDTADESNGGSAPCDADSAGTRCYELYEDNFFLSSSRTAGSCHADVHSNVAGGPGFIDLSDGGVNDPDGDHLGGLGDCTFAADTADSRLIDFGDGAVGSEPEKNGDAPNLGAFGTTDRASKSPTLHIVALDAADGGVKDGDATAAVPGLVQPRSGGVTEIRVFFNRAVTATSSGFEVRDLCDTVDGPDPASVDTSAASLPPYLVTLNWNAGTFDNEAVRIHALGDGADRIVDTENGDALDGEISDIAEGTLPSGDGTDGGDAEFAVYSLTGDVDGDQRVAGQPGNDDYSAITGFAGYPAGSCASCPEDVDADGDVDAADLAGVADNDAHMARLNDTTSFTNISSGNGLNSNTLHSMVFADFNGDGYLDMAKSNSSSSGVRTISINDGDSTFTTSTAALPAGYRGLGWGDYDNDGDLDLVGRNPSSSSSPDLLENNGQSDGLSWTLTSPAGNTNEATMFADLEGDGDLDVWNPGDDDLWHRNDGSSTFTAQDGMPGLANDDLPNAEGCTAADFTADGYPDFMWSDAEGTSTQAWTNDGDFTYTNHESVSTDFGLPEAVGSHENMEWAWGDYDNDGDLDVFISGSAGVGLYDNDGTGEFTNVSSAAGVNITATTDGADWGDYDNDGDLDLVVSKGSSSKLYANDGSGTFSDATASSGITSLGNAAGWLDVDNDGDLDLMTGVGALWRNDLDDCHYLNVIATGSGETSESPTTPIGAHVRVLQAGTSNLVGFREIPAGYNNFQPPPIQHFGLDPTALYDLEVFFPSSGSTVTASSIRPDQQTHTAGTTVLANTLQILESSLVLLADTFSRSNSTTVGNGWSETDSAANAEARILSRRLAFDSINTANQPLVSHAFLGQSTGTVTWSFTFNMDRTGGEVTYAVRLQLGDSATLVDPSISEHTGVAVNLIWGSPDQGLTDTEGFGYDVGGSITQVGVVSGDAGANVGGDALVTVTADLEAHTYNLSITGAGLVSGGGTASAVGFDDDVDIDTLRIYFDCVNDANFGDLEIDDLRIRWTP